VNAASDCKNNQIVNVSGFGRSGKLKGKADAEGGFPALFQLLVGLGVPESSSEARSVKRHAGKFGLQIQSKNVNPELGQAAEEKTIKFELVNGPVKKRNIGAAVVGGQSWLNAQPGVPAMNQFADNSEQIELIEGDAGGNLKPVNQILQQKVVTEKHLKMAKVIPFQPPEEKGSPTAESVNPIQTKQAAGDKTAIPFEKYPAVFQKSTMGESSEKGEAVALQPAKVKTSTATESVNPIQTKQAAGDKTANPLEKYPAVFQRSAMGESSEKGEAVSFQPAKVKTSPTAESVNPFQTKQAAGDKTANPFEKSPAVFQRSAMGKFTEKGEAVSFQPARVKTSPAAENISPFKTKQAVSENSANPLEKYPAVFQRWATGESTEKGEAVSFQPARVKISPATESVDPFNAKRAVGDKTANPFEKYPAAFQRWAMGESTEKAEAVSFQPARVETSPAAESVNPFKAKQAAGEKTANPLEKYPAVFQRSAMGKSTEKGEARPFQPARVKTSPTTESSNAASSEQTMSAKPGSPLVADLIPSKVVIDEFLKKEKVAPKGLTRVKVSPAGEGFNPASSEETISAKAGASLQMNSISRHRVTKDFQSHSAKVKNSYTVESLNSTRTGAKKELKNEFDLSAVKSEPLARVVNNAISKTISNKTLLRPDMFNEKLPPLILKMVNAGETRMKISLNPRSLGFMQIEISHEEDILSVKFMVGSDEVKTILENSQAELKQALSLTGLTSGEITVEIASDSTSKQTGQGRGRKEAERKREFSNAKQEIAGIQTTRNKVVRYFGYNSMEMEA